MSKRPAVICPQATAMAICYLREYRQGLDTMNTYSTAALHWRTAWSEPVSTQLANFMIAIMNGGRFEKTQVLKEETVNEMLTQELGWFKTGDYWGHDGSDPGCSTEVMLNPKTKVAVIIFTNADVRLNWVKALLLAKAEEKTP